MKVLAPHLHWPIKNVLNSVLTAMVWISTIARAETVPHRVVFLEKMTSSRLVSGALVAAREGFSSPAQVDDEIDFDIALAVDMLGHEERVNAVQFIVGCRLKSSVMFPRTLHLKLATDANQNGVSLGTITAGDSVERVDILPFLAEDASNSLAGKKIYAEDIELPRDHPRRMLELVELKAVKDAFLVDFALLTKRARSGFVQSRLPLDNSAVYASDRHFLVTAPNSSSETVGGSESTRVEFANSSRQAMDVAVSYASISADPYLLPSGQALETAVHTVRRLSLLPLHPHTLSQNVELLFFAKGSLIANVPVSLNPVGATSVSLDGLGEDLKLAGLWGQGIAPQAHLDMFLRYDQKVYYIGSVRQGVQADIQPVPNGSTFPF